MAEINWDAIREEYIKSSISLYALGKRHNVARATIQRMSKREGWVGLRNEYRAKVIAKSTEIDSETEDIIVTISRVARKVLEAIEAEMGREKSIDPLDKKYPTNYKSITGALIDLRDLLVDQSKAQEVIVKFEGDFDKWSE